MPNFPGKGDDFGMRRLGLPLARNKPKDILGWGLFGISILILALFINFFHDVYLTYYKIPGALLASIMFFYTALFVGVFVVFSLFLSRLFTQGKKKFLMVYRIVLHPLVNISVLSFLFLLL